MISHLDPKKDPARKVLKVSAWPEADQRAWEAALLPGDPLEPGGAGAQWAPQTRSMVAKAYGRWLGWLAREGILTCDSNLETRATPDRIARFIAELQTMVALSTTISYVRYLELAVRALLPNQDFGWLLPIVARVRRLPAHAHDKRSRLVAFDELFAYGLDLMERAEHDCDLSLPQRACGYRDGLMLALLAARPLRRGNFSRIEIGRHLVRRGDDYWLCFAAYEVKNRIELEMPIPTILVPCLERYLSQHRPVLCAGADRLHGSRLHPAGNYLWVTSYHSAMSPGSVYGRITALTKAKFGRCVNPHLFRDSAATSVAIDDPAHVYITKSILGHTTLRMSEKYYNQATSLEATRRYQQHIQERRGEDTSGAP